MAAYANLDGFQDNHYLARSWGLLNLGGNLALTVLTLGLVSLIPIIGPLVVLGYCVEWARQVSWGVSCPPGTQTWSWGGYLSSGWRSFVVQFGYGVIIGLAFAVIQIVPLIGQLVDTITPLVSIVVSVVVSIAVLHAAIYQRIGAGFNFSRVFQMADHDFVGLLRVMGFVALTTFVSAIVYGFIIFGSSIPSFVRAVMEIGSLSGETYNRALFDATVAFLAGILPGAGISYVINCFVGSLVQLVIYGMMGLWMRQFDVAHWGREEDPLPPTIEAQQPVYTQYSQAPSQPAGTYQPQYYDPNQQDGQQQTQQAPYQPTPTWQEMDAQAQQLWQQQYDSAQRSAQQQPAQQPAPQPQQVVFPEELPAPDQPVDESAGEGIDPQ